MERLPPPPDGAGSEPVFVDGFGRRFLTFDPENADPVEILAFERPLVDAPDFAATLGVRVARLASVRHTFYAHVRRLDRPSEHSLLLVSERVAGWRLARLLEVAEREKLTLDISAVLALLRQLIPAVSLFARHQRDLAVGTIGPERLIVTPQARLVLAEYVLGPAIEKLQLSRDRLWQDFRVPVPVSAGIARITPRADVIGIGVVALSLLLGRLLRENEYPGALEALLQKATESTGGLVRPLPGALSAWVGRALQLEGRAGFRTPQEGQVAFEEVLASEPGYVTSPAQLDAFLGRVVPIVGPPPEPGGTLGALGATGATGASSAAPSGPIAPSAPAAPEAPGAPIAPIAPAAPVASASARAESTASYGETSPTPSVGGEGGPGAPGAPASVRLRLDHQTRRWTTGALAVFALLVVLEAIVIVWLLNREPGAGLAGEGELVVSSRPAAARVAIDGEERGSTPLTVRLSPGTHILEVRVGRSEPRVIPLQIRAGVQTAQYLELQSVPTVGALDVRSDPPKVRVTVDGQNRGVTPLVIRDLPPGEHEVILEGQGRKVRQMIRVEAGVTAQLVVPMGSP